MRVSPEGSRSCGNLRTEPHQVDVRFPDGTVIRALRVSERKAENPERDYGLYLDAAWRPAWKADVIDWQDFGLPKDYEVAAALIRSAFERAKRGERVEVGCRGGLGRTGTVLACMAILAGVPVEQAVSWVRANYDPRAIETPAQEQWVQ